MSKPLDVGLPVSLEQLIADVGFDPTSAIDPESFFIAIEEAISAGDLERLETLRSAVYPRNHL